MRADMVRFQLDLTALPAIGPANEGEGEWKRAHFLVAHLSTLGLSVEHIDAPDHRVPEGTRPNLVARLPGKEHAAREHTPRIWVALHMDIVPAGDPADWATPPHEATEEGGRLYGRGTEDNQQGITSAVFAVQALVAEGLTPARDVGLLLLSDEETGNGYGIEHVLATAPHLIAPDDIVVVPDSGSTDGSYLEVGGKGGLQLRLTVHGRQTHASIPETGINPCRASSHLVVRLDDRLHRQFGVPNKLFVPPTCTFEPTLREPQPGTAGTIPGLDRIWFDCRLLPETDPERVKIVTAEVKREIEGEFGVVVDVETMHELTAAPPAPADSRAVQLLTGLLEQVRGVSARPVGIGGDTIAGALRRHGIPAVGWSTTESVAHRPNEFCIIDNMVADALLLACLFASA